MKTFVVLSILFILLFVSPVFPFDPVSIKDSNYTLVSASPSGHYVTWAWKVKLSNDVGQKYRVGLTVQLVDFSGYEIDHAFKAVDMDMWDTKELTGQGFIERALWDKVSGAKYSIEAREQ